MNARVDGQGNRVQIIGVMDKDKVLATPGIATNLMSISKS
jgi:hypothetical protein